MSKSRQEFGKEMQEEIDKMFLDMVFNTPKMWINFETEHAVNYRLSKEQAASRFINLNPTAIEVSTSILRIVGSRQTYKIRIFS